MQFKMRTQTASGTDHQGCQILSTVIKKNETEQTNKTPQTTQTKKPRPKPLLHSLQKSLKPPPSIKPENLFLHFREEN